MSQPALMESLRRWDPEQIGGYVLLGRLGAGAMGQVYLGRSASGRLVAVKTIKIELAEESDFRTRFAQEVAAARRVSGAFTAAVVAADPEADMPWLATAYVPAPALSTLVRACGPMPAAAVRWLAVGCAEALESIHNAGLVHRDLKPSNVLVSLDGPRVIDFGLARAAERIQLTVTRGAVGTPAYMAPEQARDTRQATTASDVFSLGATMLFAATGHAPYHGETVMDVLVRLATEPPDLSGLPHDLADIVQACLHRDPRKRPTSAAVVANLVPDHGLADDGWQPGPSSLPGPALALIAEYRREPNPMAGNDWASEDPTFGSQPALSQPDGPVGRLRPRRRQAGLHPEAAGGLRAAGQQIDVARDEAAGAGGPRRRGVLLTAYSAAAAVLLAGGGACGFAVADRGRSSPPPPPGAIMVPPAQASQSSTGHPARPQVAFYQSFGDGHTVFVLHGVGWAPGLPVTVTLAGAGISPDHPVADRIGTFSYAINQAHEFFAGPLPSGRYQVVVTAAGGARAEAGFVVGAGPPGPTSTTGPPGVSTTPGR